MDALRRARASWAAVALAAVLAAPRAPAAEPQVPARSRALLLLRVLVYDRNLDRHAGSRAKVALAYRPGDAASEADRDALVAAFAAVSREVVADGRPVSAVPLPWKGEADLAARVAELRPLAIYVCEGLEASAPEVARVSRRERVLTAGGSRALAEGGLAIALVSRGPRAAVVVNLAAARAEGAELDAALLALAEVIHAPSADAR